MRCAAGGATTACSAAWCEERGLANDAVWHALAAEEPVWAARLMERHFDEQFYLRGEGATVQRWIATLPAELVISRPRLLLAQALLVLAGGRAATRCRRAGVHECGR